MNTAVEFLSPKTMPPTQGYSQMVHVKSGELIYFSGQVALNSSGELVGNDYGTQLEQVFCNIKAGLEAHGLTFDHLIKLNFFVSSKVPSDQMGVHFSIRDRYINLETPPASAFVFVDRLVRPEWLLECEAIAVKPSS